MAVNRAANRFANALFTIAEQKNNIFGIKTSLEQLVKLYRKNAEFRFIVLSKRIEKKQKIEILKNSIVGKINSNAFELIKMLLDMDIIRELPLINNRYQLIALDKKESSKVSIIVADQFNDKQKNDFLNSIKTKLNKKIDFKIDVDSSIIGGIILRIDNKIIDGSIKRKLEKIREHLVLN